MSRAPLILAPVEFKAFSDAGLIDKPETETIKSPRGVEITILKS